MDEPDAPPDEQAARLRPTAVRRVVLVAVWAVAVVAVYVALSLAFPRTVPRFAFLPKPPATETTTEHCETLTEDWQSNGVFWSRVVWSDLGLCVEGA